MSIQKKLFLISLFAMTSLLPFAMNKALAADPDSLIAAHGGGGGHGGGMHGGGMHGGGWGGHGWDHGNWGGHGWRGNDWDRGDFNYWYYRPGFDVNVGTPYYYNDYGYPYDEYYYGDYGNPSGYYYGPGVNVGLGF